MDNEQISHVHNNTAPAVVLNTSPQREHRGHEHKSRERHSRRHERKSQSKEERVKEFEKTVEDEVAECEIITPEVIPLEQIHGLAPSSPAAILKSFSSPKANRIRPVSLPAHLPDTVSPHHHWRHRNRERNKKRAMQQVAEWIEREHAWTTAMPQVIVQRHEHHHIHEHHHHHHYHHYQET